MLTGFSSLTATRWVGVPGSPGRLVAGGGSQKDRCALLEWLVRELVARGRHKRERCGLMALLLSVAICFLAMARLFSNCRAV